MSPHYTYARALRPIDFRKKPCDAINSAITAPATWFKENPSEALRYTASYGLPLAGITLSSSLISLLPLGPLGPVLGVIATSFGRFKLHQNLAGNYYAMLHAAGLAGVSGQVLSLVGFMSLGALLGPSGVALQSYFTSLVLSTGGLQAPLIGLALSLVTNFSAWMGIFPSFIGGCGASVLIKELRSFAIFKGLGWSLGKLERVWRRFIESLWSTRFAERLSWARGEQRQDCDEKSGTCKQSRKKGNRYWRFLKAVTERCKWRTSSHHPQPDEHSPMEQLEEWEIVGCPCDKVEFEEEEGALVDDAPAHTAFPEPSMMDDSAPAWLDEIDNGDECMDGSAISELDHYQHAAWGRRAQ